MIFTSQPKSRKLKSKCWQITGSWHSDREHPRSPGYSASFQEPQHWLTCFSHLRPWWVSPLEQEVNLAIHCDVSGNSRYHKQQFWHKHCLQCLRNFSQVTIFNSCTLPPVCHAPWYRLQHDSTLGWRCFHSYHKHFPGLHLQLVTESTSSRHDKCISQI